MFRIDIRDNLKETSAWLDDVQREQMPFATALALTRTAALVKEAELREIDDVFDRPTPYTRNSLFTKPATKRDLNAYVWLKDDRAGSGTPATQYLSPNIAGGLRTLKRFETMLRGRGLLPDGYYAVPGSAATFDAFGNMSRGQIIQILSYFKTFNVAGYSANITDKRKGKLARGTRSKVGYVYFVGRPGDGKLPLGIWQRFNLGHGTAIKPVILFVRSARYDAIFDFAFVAERVVEREFPRQFEAALRQALATARKP